MENLKKIVWIKIIISGAVIVISLRSGHWMIHDLFRSGRHAKALANLGAFFTIGAIIYCCFQVSELFHIIKYEKK